MLVAEPPTHGTVSFQPETDPKMTCSVKSGASIDIRGSEKPVLILNDKKKFNQILPCQNNAPILFEIMWTELQHLTLWYFIPENANAAAGFISRLKSNPNETIQSKLRQNPNQRN